MSASTHGEREQELDHRTSQTDRSPSDGQLEDDEVYHLLQTKRRRLVLRYLRGREGPIEMRDVAEQVAAWEHDTTVAELRSKQRQRVYIPLYQTHLPKLDEAGVIEYNQSRGVIEPTDGIHQLYRVLEKSDGTDGETRDETDVPAVDEDATKELDRAETSSRSSTTYFGGATLLSTGLLTAAWSGLIVLPGLLLSSVITALFTVVTLGVGFRR